MISLLVDTCTANLIVALCKGNKIVSKLIKKNDGNLSTDFTQLVASVINESGISIDDIDTIFVSNGPGSFTGTRIGVTFAKVLGWSKKIKVVPISSLELMASGCSNDYIIPILEARRGYVYGGIYNNQLENIKNDSYIQLCELEKIANSYSNFSFISCDKFAIDVIDPTYDIVKVIEKHKNDIGINPHLLNPNYLKKTEAEEKIA